MHPLSVGIDTCAIVSHEVSPIQSTVGHLHEVKSLSALPSCIACCYSGRGRFSFRITVICFSCVCGSVSEVTVTSLASKNIDKNR